MFIGLSLAVNNALSSGSAPFSPLSLFSGGEQGGWYDPSDLSTLWQDDARTTPVTTDGQTVGCMDDKSGNGNHLKQATAGKRPQYKTSGGLHWLAFDGVDDALASTSIDFSTSDKISIFFAGYKPINQTSILAEISTNTGGNTGSFYALIGNDSGYFNSWISRARGNAASVNGQSATTAVFSGADTANLIIKHDISGDLSTISRNGTAGTSGIADKGAGNFGNYPLYVGSRAESSLYFNGKIYGLTIVSKLTVTGEDTDMKTYLDAKAGL